MSKEFLVNMAKLLREYNASIGEKSFYGFYDFVMSKIAEQEVEK